MVRIRNLGGDLIATAPQLSSGFIEIRGLGIINVTNLFGLKAYRKEKRIDLVINLFSGEMSEMERLGLERQYINILGVDVEHLNLPVAPGRDMCRLVEVAALGRYLRDSGYDMASEFNKRLNKEIANRTVYPGNAE
jgi:HPr kinase/phosphorylase